MTRERIGLPRAAVGVLVLALAGCSGSSSRAATAKTAPTELSGATGSKCDAELDALRESEKRYIELSCGVCTLLLNDQGERLQKLASDMAQRTGTRTSLAPVLEDANGEVSKDIERAAEKAISRLTSDILGRKPDFVLVANLIPAGVAVDGDISADALGDLSARDLVNRVMSGSTGVGTWAAGGKAYRVAGAPIRTDRGSVVGGLFIGRFLDAQLATALAKSTRQPIAFYKGGELLASSEQLDAHDAVIAWTSANKPTGESRYGSGLCVPGSKEMVTPDGKLAFTVSWLSLEADIYYAVFLTRALPHHEN